MKVPRAQSNEIASIEAFASLPSAERNYAVMSLIRTVEETLLRLFSENRLFGTTHTSVGQEADAAGIFAALDCERDIVWSNHRCHGHYIAYGGDIRRLIAEIMGLAEGVCGGRGGSQHLCFRNFYSNGIQGGIAPVSVGCALAEKETGAIGVAFFGDGTMGQGAVYESFNLASLLDVPVLFIVEDNKIAQTTPIDVGVAGNITNRAAAFGIECFHTDSTDVDVIAAQAKTLVTTVRDTQRPVFWHIETVRLGPHSKGDDTRSAETLELLQARDPLALHRHRISGAHDIDTWCRDSVDKIVASLLEQVTT
jgi:acetoin:2,6-dichlorophenolindophenol oxidoreductase subunit alpha